MASEDVLKHYGEEEGARSPLFPILAIALLLVLVVAIVPYYGMKLDPNPTRIPALADVVPEQYDVPFSHFNDTSLRNYPSFLTPNDPVIKTTADRIVTLAGCDSAKICQLKAIFQFVQQRFNYVSDPTAYEYVKTPRESLRAEGGDCDDASVLLANLLQAIGIRTRFVFIPQHMYVQAYFPEALRKYREGDWINLDATCTYCGVGEIPIENRELPKTYVG